MLSRSLFFPILIAYMGSFHDQESTLWSHRAVAPEYMHFRGTSCGDLPSKRPTAVLGIIQLLVQRYQLVWEESVRICDGLVDPGLWYVALPVGMHRAPVQGRPFPITIAERL